MTDTDQLLQLTRELTASPHFSYQPQMRLRNGAIVLEVLDRKRLLTFDQGAVCVISTNNTGSGVLPDLEDDATVGVLRGMALRVFSCSVMASAALTMAGIAGDGESWARVLIAADKFLDPKPAP